MSKLISNTELTRALEFHLSSAIKVNIISAFFTKPGYNWLSEKTSVESSITIVGRFTPKDFIQKASSIDAIRLSLLSGFNVKAISNLHAKIFQIDEDTIYTGSANMTGKGLSLVENSNLEACVSVPPTIESKAFIKNIMATAIALTPQMLDSMQNFIDALPLQRGDNIPENWPNEIMPNIKQLFVSDFPLCSPGQSCETYLINSSLEFAIIESNSNSFDKAQSLFKGSKAYRWLKDIVSKNNQERDLSFGQISSLLHEALCDDPAPYRKDIKTLQANLYKYVGLYAADEIEIYTPRHSQVLRLVST